MARLRLSPAAGAAGEEQRGARLDMGVPIA